MEIEVLMGAEQSLARLKPQLVVERIKSSEADLRALMTRLGYQVFPMGGNLLAIHASDPTIRLVQAA
jgi:hypothetical protein